MTILWKYNKEGELTICFKCILKTTKCNPTWKNVLTSKCISKMKTSIPFHLKLDEQKKTLFYMFTEYLHHQSVGNNFCDGSTNNKFIFERIDEKKKEFSLVFVRKFFAISIW